MDFPLSIQQQFLSSTKGKVNAQAPELTKFSGPNQQRDCPQAQRIHTWRSVVGLSVAGAESHRTVSLPATSHYGLQICPNHFRVSWKSIIYTEVLENTRPFQH